MEYAWLSDLLTFALPGGFLGATASWVVGRRRRNNDFLSEMQRSIDLLSEKYNAVLQENVALRREKADWQVLQQELLIKVDRLTREVEGLRRNFNLKTGTHEPKLVSKSRRTSLRRAADAAGGLLRGITDTNRPDGEPRPDDRQPPADTLGGVVANGKLPAAPERADEAR